MKGLFLNTNWAYLIDSRSFDESRYRGYTHAPAIKFTNGNEQQIAVNKTMDILLAAIKEFRRDEIRYIEWTLNEITDNVINHSQSKVGGFVQVTNYRQRGQIELTVADAGVGIPKTLRDANSLLKSDSEALADAIKEGVTRDSKIGQGNGLYGTWKITRQSKGDLNIYSGYSTLISTPNSVQILTERIPVIGTLVSAKIGYSDTVDLSDALTFKGKVHEPTDYIDAHFDQDKEGNIKFILKSETSGFGSRVAGEPVRRKLKNLVGCLNGGQIIIDAEGVPFVSSSFADEVFGKLFLELGALTFSAKIKMINLDKLVAGLIDKAIMQRMRQ